MDKNNFKEIEEDYIKTKKDFQTKDNLLIAEEITSKIKEHANSLNQVFRFLINSFKGKLRRDEKTPLVFHSIYLTKLLYACGIKDLDTLLVAALHDVLEDTDVTEEEFQKQSFLENKQYLINYLRILKENKSLSREPDGKTLPPRYREHIKRIINAPKEVINVEILDRFCDLMDLDYITKLPEEQKRLRLKSKIIKVKSFVENITKDRNDFNQNCLDLFLFNLQQVETTFSIKANQRLFSRRRHKVSLNPL